MSTQAAAKTGDGASSDGGNAAAGDATSGGMPAQDAAKTGNGASSNGGGAGDAAAGDALFGVRPQQLVGRPRAPTLPRMLLPCLALFLSLMSVSSFAMAARNFLCAASARSSCRQGQSIRCFGAPMFQFFWVG